MFAWLEKRRRLRILETPFPEAWSRILEANLPLCAELDGSERRTLRDKTQIFVAEKRFEGCGGLELTDEIRVTIAAQACVLLLHLDEPGIFPSVSTILVYPSAYKVPPQKHMFGGGVHVEGDTVRAGESWSWGTLILAWDHVKRRSHDHNVVLHEFAHALDWEDGVGDGAPILPNRAMYGPWARVLGAEFERLARTAESGAETVLDVYGAKNPAEFFAVATEAFFEQPKRLKRDHPDLYDQLSAFYHQSPASRP